MSGPGTAAPERRPRVIVLTGSIGMGKSTTAAMFREAGIPVWDADAAVHRLYAPGGAAVAPMAAAFPEAVHEGAVDSARLREIIARDPQALGRIEAIVHPLVAEDRARFLEQAAAAGADLVVLDIPLWFEGGGGGVEPDAVVVVSAPAEEQRRRVLARPGMTEEHFERILARQMPDAEKRHRADFVIPTRTLEEARAEVERIIRLMRSGWRRPGPAADTRPEEAQDARDRP